MKKYFFTLDLEEWWDLEYLRKYKAETHEKLEYIPQMLPFFEMLRELNILTTVFVVGSAAIGNKDIIRSIKEMGHEIACHSLNHALLYGQTNAQFIAQTKEAKDILEDITGENVLGYRAPCFSMDNEKLEMLWELGFSYDASLIRFKEHALYGELDMTQYNERDDLVFEKDGHVEFEMPTLRMASKSIPISGGGYFRLFPLWLMKSYIKKYWKEHDNFVFYAHPFELCELKLDASKGFALEDRIRFNIGRKNNLKKIANYLQWLKSYDVKFLRLCDFLVH